MAFKKKNVDKKFLKYKDCEFGQVLVEGVYEKAYQGTYGVQYDFRTDDDFIQVLNSSGHLNYLLNEYASFGDYCKITYEGSKVLEKGPMKGKDAHQFSLEIDDDRFDKSFARNGVLPEKKPTPPAKDESVKEETCDSELEDMTL